MDDSKILQFFSQYADAPGAITHGEMPEVLRTLERVFEPVSATKRLTVRLTCEDGRCPGDASPERGTLHIVSEGTLNGDPGWLETACEVCAYTEVWHRASNYRTTRYVKK
jgi:hypothetical protein